MKETKISGYVNGDTGEVLEDYIPMLVSKKKTHFVGMYGDNWMIISQQAFQTAAKDPDLTLEPKNVLMYLFGKLDFENFIQVPQVQIAKELNLHKQAVNRAIRLLEKKEILVVGPKVGKSKTWRLNPNYGFKGNPKGKVNRDPKTGHLRLIK